MKRKVILTVAISVSSDEDISNIVANEATKLIQYELNSKVKENHPNATVGLLYQLSRVE